jgi:hypothetical protein
VTFILRVLNFHYKAPIHSSLYQLRSLHLLCLPPTFHLSSSVCWSKPPKEDIMIHIITKYTTEKDKKIKITNNMQLALGTGHLIN